jgi:sensor histidine kinase YesM
MDIYFIKTTSSISKNLFFVLYSFIALSSKAQKPAFYLSPNDIVKDSIVFLSDYTYAYIDSTSLLSFEEVRQLSIDKFEKFDIAKHGRKKFKQQLKPIWYTFKITTIEAANDVNWVIYFGGLQGCTDVYEIKDNQVNYTKGGYTTSGLKAPTTYSRYEHPIRFGKPNSHEFFIKAKWGSKNGFEPRVSTQATSIGLHADSAFEHRHEIGFQLSVIAITAFLGIFFLLRNFKAREKTMLYYGLFQLAFSARLLNRMETYYDFFIVFGNIPFGHTILDIFIDYTCFFFYGKFIQYFFDLKTTLPKWDKVLNYIYYLLGFLFIVKTVWMIAIYSCGKVLYPLALLRLAGFAIILFSTLLLFKLFFSNLKHAKLVATGSLVLNGGAFLYVLMTEILGIWPRGHSVFEIATLIEVLLVTLAMGYKARDRDLLQLNTQSKLLAKEKENVELQRQLNDSLEMQVAERTQEIIQKNKELARRKAEQLSAEFNQKLAEAEFKALKAQMSPHFIFNCLNSIKTLIQEKEDKEAIHYLSQFSKLIRNVLNHSENKQITLEEELQMCKLYLEMEKLRFQDSFHYKITIDPKAPLDFVKVPPMILQPLLENAIWHGLMHKEGERLVKLDIQNGMNAVKCVVQDNGIGRSKAALLKSISVTKHKSFGTRLIKDRMKIHQQLFNNDFTLNFIDIFINGKASGTKVELTFEI